MPTGFRRADCDRGCRRGRGGVDAECLPPHVGRRPYRAPRSPDGKPDLERRLAGRQHRQLRHSGPSRAPGIGADSGATAHGVPGLVRATPSDLPAPEVRALGAVGAVPAGEGVVDGNEIPYQPWAAAKKKENLEHWLERDPEIKCFMPGVPRATYMPYPFQILQGTDTILMAYRIRRDDATYSDD